MKRLIDDIISHPLNDIIYADKADAELVESVEQKGILTPILITWDNRIVSGHRRFDAAKRAGLKEVPVVLFESRDEFDIIEALIETNRQRTKTGEQLGRETQQLWKVEEERARERQVRKPISVVQNVAPVIDNGKARDHVGQRTGVSGFQAEKAKAVVDAIDDLETQGKQDEAKKLRDKLNKKSVGAAHKDAKEKGHIKIQPKRPSKKPELITLAQWEGMSEPEKQMALIQPGKAKFNSTNDNVEWALWTWNPITGCLHNCAYCYARDIANRFYDHLPLEERFDPVFYPGRLLAPSNTKQPDLSQISDPVKRMGLTNVFVCSMADLFGKWVPAEWIEAVLGQIRNNPQWNFLLLSKFPIRMAEFDYPFNVWLGTTVDYQWAVDRAQKAFIKIKASGFGGVCWLSCEPMMEKLTFASLDMFDWVVIGGSSKSTQTPEFKPPRDWINHLESQAYQSGCKVYEKTNLLERTREYPNS